MLVFGSGVWRAVSATLADTWSAAAARRALTLIALTRRLRADSRRESELMGSAEVVWAALVIDTPASLLDRIGSRRGPHLFEVMSAAA
jgi:hypothetical protein